MPAYYSLLQLPGEEEASYVALRSFVPISDDDSRKELTAFMVGETRSDGTSRLVSYEMSNLLAPGPAIVASNISTNPDISRELTLLNDQGSLVDFGDMLLLPVDDSVLYVRPMYVRAQGTQIPLLAGVIAARWATAPPWARRWARPSASSIRAPTSAAPCCRRS